MHKRILVVDDDDDLRDVITEFLKMRNFVVVQAENGEDALEILTKVPIDLALLDVRMPKMDGLKLLKTIKKARLTFPVIMMTGFELSRDKIALLEYKPEAFITKKFTMDALITLVNKLLHIEGN
jgi:two-component system response regulator PilR (NtrC family)